ncbi:MAG: HEAT repeat domain-containing protein [Roseivirga sp.]
MNISESVVSRKGARSPKEVPADVLNLLNSGLIPTVNLSEWLAVDQRTLLKQVLSATGQETLITEFIDTIDGLKKQTATQIIRTVGQLILDSELIEDKPALISAFSSHTSDTVRCWAAYAVGLDDTSDTATKFSAIQAYAADSHFGVREIAWMAVRDTIISDLGNALGLLKDWSLSKDENLRRFASEATRPRGVWCPHIEALKDQPGLAMGILEPLRSDPSKYVRDSVGNWLNDASKTQPDWVMELCGQWTSASDSKETAYIVKKARRTIDKK